ncbi:hypothetical protein QOZ95_003512 [Paenibacillus brasilensis]|uniref:Uncharacterized protein n=1 Tax=Paenibacillus brasilensis TaxID=128574 RepID=A0ABU0L0W5_9BACL|nr:hypothetical protein [Paenibacillus brasilensis]
MDEAGKNYIFKTIVTNENAKKILQGMNIFLRSLVFVPKTRRNKNGKRNTITLRSKAVQKRTRDG